MFMDGAHVETHMLKLKRRYVLSWITAQGERRSFAKSGDFAGRT